MKNSLGSLGIQQCVVVLSATLVAMQAWAGPVGPRPDISSAARASSSFMARQSAAAPQFAGDEDDQPEMFGRTYGEWAAAWVQWSDAGPVGQNAITDTTGEFCGANQPKRDVWFLAGTFGQVGVERACTIPRDRALFYPLFEGPWIDCPGTADETLSDAEVRGILAGITDLAGQLTSTLDGVAISSLQVLTTRTQSPTFRSILPDNPAIADACTPRLIGGKTGRRIVDGYWVMLPPLSPGAHTLTLHGALPDIGFANGVTYHLTVLGKK